MKYLLILLTTLSCFAQPWSDVTLSQPTPAAAPANLTMGNVLNESFEGTGYETNTWAETSSPDEDAALLGSPISKLGSQCFTSVWPTNTTRPSAYFDFGSVSTTTTYFRFFFYILSTGIGSTDYSGLWAVGESTDPLATSQSFSLNVLNTAGQLGLRVYNGTAQTAIQNISAGTWYRVEVRWVSNGASTARIYTASNGQQIGSDTSFNSSASQDFRYLHIGTLFGDNTKGWTIQIDGIGISTTDWLGE